MTQTPSPPAGATDPGVFDVMRALKEGTAALHRALEHDVSVLGPRSTEEDYVRYLERMFGFHEPLEGQLGALASQLPPALELPSRLKTPLLAADLLAVGLSPDQVQAMPRCAFVPTLHSPAAALGVLYVLEGATLGGKVLHRALTPRLPHLMQHAASYLQAYGDAVGTRWKTLGNLLRAELPTAERAAPAIAAAQATFGRLATWFGSEQEQG